jgi:hypothetical protein
MFIERFVFHVFWRCTCSPRHRCVKSRLHFARLATLIPEVAGVFDQPNPRGYRVGGMKHVIFTSSEAGGTGMDL